MVHWSLVSGEDTGGCKFPAKLKTQDGMARTLISASFSLSDFAYFVSYLISYLILTDVSSLLLS